MFTHRVSEHESVHPVEQMLSPGSSMALVASIMIWGKGFMPRIAILIGLVAGSILAFIMGKVDLNNVVNVDWFGIVTPFALGLPEFKVAAIFSMLLAMLVTMIESTGDYIAIGEVCEKPVGQDDIAAGLRAEGLGTMLGGIMCSFPYTTYSQNTGVLRVSGVRSRWVVALCGVFLILLGVFPKLSALAACVPVPVLGGASLVLFGSIACTGLKILGRVDMEDKSSLLIVSISLGLAMLAISNPIYFNFLPDSARMLLNNPITLGGVSALLLNYLFNIIIQTNNLEGRLNACAAEIEDNLSITVDAAIPYGFIAPVIREFCKQYPYVNLHLKSMNLDEALTDLNTGYTKLALLLTLPNYPADIGFCRLGSLQIAEVAHVNHPLCQMSSISFADLSNHRQLVFSPHGDNLNTSEYLRSPQRIYIDNYNTLIQMTLAGFGWSVLPRQIVNDYVSRGQMMELPPESYPHTKWQVNVDLLWNLKAELGPAALWLKQRLSTQMIRGY